MSVAPISPAAAALRVQIVGAVEAAHVTAVGSRPEAYVEAPETAPRPPANPLQQAIAAARTAAAGRQAGLAPLFADLARAFESPKTPPEVRAAIGQVLSMELPATGPMTAETVRLAVARSGLFLEAHLAPAPEPASPPVPDLKAALLVLRQLLAQVQPEAPTPGRPAKTPPPTRDGALAGQAPAAATLPRDADLAAIAQRLGGDADQAIARQLLHQLASLPESGTNAWMFELPVATPQGAAIAQFEIDQEAHTASDGETSRTWRVRFSLDVEPLGPVHVQLGAGAERAAVIIWAEREDALERLRSRGGELAGALPADVVFHPGAPRRPPPPAGGLMDQTL
jgi:hypothetical protein